MELEQLRAFVAVAECGSFSQGARRLYVSHSSVSRAVAALEEELGARLLLRNNRVLGRTAAGEVLLTEAKKLLAAAEEAAARTRAAGEEEKNAAKTGA